MALLAYFGRLAVQLGCPQWELEVAFQPPQDDDDAAILIIGNEDRATLYVPSTFFAWEAERQRRVLTHEALHLLFERARAAYDDAIGHLVQPGQAGAVTVTPDRLMERGIETAARAIARFLPMPDLPR